MNKRHGGTRWPWAGGGGRSRRRAPPAPGEAAPSAPATGSPAPREGEGPSGTGHPRLDGVSPQGPPAEPRTWLLEDEEGLGAPWGSPRCRLRCARPRPRRQRKTRAWSQRRPPLRPSRGLSLHPASEDRAHTTFRWRWSLIKGGERLEERGAHCRGSGGLGKVPGPADGPPAPRGNWLDPACAVLPCSTLFRPGKPCSLQRPPPSHSGRPGTSGQGLPPSVPCHRALARVALGRRNLGHSSPDGKTRGVPRTRRGAQSVPAGGTERGLEMGRWTEGW